MFLFPVPNVWYVVNLYGMRVGSPLLVFQQMAYFNGFRLWHLTLPFKILGTFTWSDICWFYSLRGLYGFVLDTKTCPSRGKRKSIWQMPEVHVIGLWTSEQILQISNTQTQSPVNCAFYKSIFNNTSTKKQQSIFYSSFTNLSLIRNFIYDTEAVISFSVN